jgi:hypothetical protein
MGEVLMFTEQQAQQPASLTEVIFDFDILLSVAVEGEIEQPDQYTQIQAVQALRDMVMGMSDAELINHMVVSSINPVYLEDQPPGVNAESLAAMAEAQHRLRLAFKYFEAMRKAVEASVNDPPLIGVPM